MDFDDYVRTHGERLKKFAVVLCVDHGLAEDVLQEVLFRAYRNWDVVGNVASTHAYVRKMMVNELVSWKRKWSRVETAADVKCRETGDPDVFATSDSRFELWSAVTNLPSKQRAAVALRYFEDCSDRDIGLVLGCRRDSRRSTVERPTSARSAISTTVN